MNDLTNNNTTMTSLELLEVINGYRLDDDKKELRHDTFMKKIEDELEESAPKFLGTGTYLNGTGSEVKRPIYNLPKEECMLMAMRESKYVRKQTVEYIKKLESKSMVTFQSMNSEQMSLVLNIQKDKEKALLEVKEKENQLLVAAPKVKFYEDVGNAKLNVGFGELAKAFGCGRNKMMEKLRDLKILMKNNTPYQRYADQDYFKVVQSVNSGYLSNTTYITGKGELYLFNKLKKVGFLKENKVTS